MCIHPDIYITYTQPYIGLYYITMDLSEENHVYICSKCGWERFKNFKIAVEIKTDNSNGNAFVFEDDGQPRASITFNTTLSTSRICTAYSLYMHCVPKSHLGLPDSAGGYWDAVTLQV